MSKNKTRLGVGSFSIILVLLFLVLTTVNIHGMQLGVFLFKNQIFSDIVGVVLLGGAIWLAWHFRDDLFLKSARWIVTTYAVVLIALWVLINLGKVWKMPF